MSAPTRSDHHVPARALRPVRRFVLFWPTLIFLVGLAASVGTPQGGIFTFDSLAVARTFWIATTISAVLCASIHKPKLVAATSGVIVVTCLGRFVAITNEMTQHFDVDRLLGLAIWLAMAGAQTLYAFAVIALPVLEVFVVAAAARGDTTRAAP